MASSTGRLNAVQTSDGYDPNGATIQNVVDSSGGFYNIADADVFCEVQYGSRDALDWTDEVRLAAGTTGSLPRGVEGIRFRSAVSGTPATVTAALFLKDQPAFNVGSGPVTVTGLPINFQHNGSLVGQEPTADFVDGGGLTWTLVDDGANTRVTITPAVAFPVTSVFGRTGAVVATSGDYTAAQVTNAADKSSASAQVFTGNVVAGATFSLPQATTGATLATSGSNTAQVATATTNAMAVGVANNTDTVARFVYRPDRLEWGPGTGARDTFATRTAAAQLTITGDLIGANGIFSTNATSGVGYAVGAGGAVTQATSKSTGVTLNTVTGRITMNAAALGAGASVSFVLNNSNITTNDVVLFTVGNNGLTAFSNYRVDAPSVVAGAGGVSIRVTNVSAGSLSEALIINFAILKAVSA